MKVALTVLKKPNTSARRVSSWKDMENTPQKVPESPGKPAEMLCTYPVYRRVTERVVDSLPMIMFHLTSAPSLLVFRRKLKTHLFRQSYPDIIL